MKNKITSIMLLCIVLALCVFVGFVLVFYSWSIAEFTDDNAAMEWLWSDYPEDMNREAYAEFNENWHRGMDEFRTNKWPIHDRGIGLLTLGGLLLLVLQICKWCSVFSISQIQTPKRKITLLMLGLIGFAFMIASMVHEITRIMDRHEVPIWADSSAIPLFAISRFAKEGFLVIFIVGVLQLWIAKFPAYLFEAHLKTTGRSLLLWVPYGILTMWFVGSVFEAVYYGVFLAIPGFLIWIYVVLSTRAGLVKNISKR